MENKFEVKLAEGQTELIIRQGQALQQVAPRVKDITGQIDAPRRWLDWRKDEVEQDQSHILVDREKMMIILNFNDKDFYQNTIAGVLTYDAAFLKFGINKGKYISTHEMSELIKMNRTLFDNQGQAAELVSALKNLKAKVSQNHEKADNNRGDKTQIFEQTVETNVPKVFNMNMPIFKGQGKKLFSCEVYFNPADTTCTLVSAEANDIVATTIDNIINSELTEIVTIYPNLTIIEL